MTLPSPSRTIGAVALALCLAFGGLSIAGVGGAESSSKKSSKPKTKVCKSATYPNKNPGGYFTSLKVRGTSCSQGRKMQKAYYKCRVRNGGRKGRCKASRVLKYKCKESRPSRSQSDEQLNAKVTCRRGKYGLIIHTYQQNLR